MSNGDNNYKMDLFIEKIVTKKKTGLDSLIVFGTFFLGILLIILVFIVQLPDIISSFRLIIMAAIGYGIYRLVKSKNLEFEYAVTNGELDIDKIIAQKKRKRIFSAHCRNFEILAKVHSDKYNESYSGITNKIFAGSDMRVEDMYFAVLYFQEKEQYYILNQMLEC